MSCFGAFHGQKQYLSHILFWGTQHVQQWRAHSAVHNVICVFYFYFYFFCSFLAFLLEGHNPGYSHYKSCLLDVRPQTGDRLCNLVSLSIPLGFMGRCLTLQAGYLLATLKATFLLTSHLGSHTYNVCMHADMQEKKRGKKIKTSVFSVVVKLYRPHRPYFFCKNHTFCIFWGTDSHPQLTHDHVNSHVHFFPPTHYVHQLDVQYSWMQQCVWRYRMASVANNYQISREPVAVTGNSWIKVPPEDPACHAAAALLIADSWVSHVKWRAGKCEIPDKVQSLKKPWSCSNEGSDEVWVWACLAERWQPALSASHSSGLSICGTGGGEVEVFVYLTS